MDLEDQVISIYAMTYGFGRAVPVEKIQEYAADLLRFIKSNHPGVRQTIGDQKILTEETEAALKAAITAYNQSVGYEVPEGN
jgi:F-type H+-transporting ATPase subunit alpha